MALVFVLDVNAPFHLGLKSSTDYLANQYVWFYVLFSLQLLIYVVHYFLILLYQFLLEYQVL